MHGLLREVLIRLIFFVSKEHLFFSLKIWLSLFVLFLLIYYLGNNKY